MAMSGARVRILVLEDDPRLAAEIVRGLGHADFDVELVTNGTAARDAIDREPGPDLVVLDLNVPEMSGLEVLAHAQSRSSTPILVLTAATSLEDRVTCFRLGAVDFVAKPFWMEELVARIHARLRRPGLGHKTGSKKAIAWAEAEIDVDARAVSVGGTPVPLTKTEFNVLAYLVERPGRAVTRAQLAMSCLPEGEAAAASERTVDTYVARVRKKLGETAGAYLVTVWGVGYRFVTSPPVGR
jgi:DNA-binding response OmpR family regulator